MKKKLLVVLCIFALTLIVLSGCVPKPQSTSVPSSVLSPSFSPFNSPSASSPLFGSTVAEVHFIDVDQADSILIKSDGQNVLIDAGTNKAGSSVIQYIKDQGITKIDYIIGTHPHEDHIGGLDTVINGLNIGQIIMPKYSSNTQTYLDVLTAIKNKNLKITAAQAGHSFTAGNCTFDFLAPDGEYDGTNNYSAVIRMTAGNVSMLFTGDAEEQSEQRILDSGAPLKSDLLKVGHHGSSSSTCTSFLNAVSPKYGVISVGKDNSYNHPHGEVLDRLSDKGVVLYRTDIMGTIIASTDGNNISFSSSKGNLPSATASAEITATANPTSTTNTATGTQTTTYIGNTGSKKFHLPSCSGLPAQNNRIIFNSRQEALDANMSPCSRCNP